MLKDIKTVLASTKTDAQKINEIQELADSSFESSEVVEMLKKALGKPKPGMPWDGMTGHEMKFMLGLSTVSKSEYEHLGTEDEDSLRLVLNHWAAKVKIDAGNHIEPTSPLGKRVYNLTNSGGKNNPKPETILGILQDLGLSDAFSIQFRIKDSFTQGQAVTINNNIARLIDRANPFQWWCEVIVDGNKEIQLSEIRDIKSV